MKRRLIAAVWITGTTTSLLLAAVFLVGCCVLPFHGVMHKVMPLCETAANVIRGEHAGHADHEHDATPASPAREKQEPVKRVFTEVPDTFRVAALSAETRVIALSSIASYRSFITLGAMRCDRDVGLHVLVATFLI
ncbi:MAG: hypothetical protein ACTHQM_23025 [Thermoanaerobaculia bacterium]